MTVMGYCKSCGARCQAVPGSHGGGSRSRGTAIAAAALTDRRIGYVIESRSSSALICRDCVSAAVNGAPA